MAGADKRGLYRKFTVTRTDGSSEPGEKHYLCNYFVLDLEHDPFAGPALKAYAKACAKKHPELAKHLRLLARTAREPRWPPSQRFGPPSRNMRAMAMLHRADYQDQKQAEQAERDRTK